MISLNTLSKPQVDTEVHLTHEESEAERLSDLLKTAPLVHGKADPEIQFDCRVCDVTYTALEGTVHLR